jgi:hypothetical protein
MGLRRIRCSARARHRAAGAYESYRRTNGHRRRFLFPLSTQRTRLADHLPKLPGREWVPQPRNYFSPVHLLRPIGPPAAAALHCANLNTRGRRSQRSSNRLHPSDGCCRRKEHRKRIRLIRPRQSEAEQGDQRNYGELPYVGVQSLLSTLPRAQVSFELNEPRGAKCGTTSCRRRAASTLSARSISRPQIKVTADEVRSFLPYLGQTRNDAPSAL